MTMPRPLMQSRIGDLEALFAASKGKLEVLAQLEHELQFRQVPRAVDLLELVERAKAAKGIARAGESPAVSDAQLSLLSPPALVETERLPIRAPVSSAVASAQLARASIAAQPSQAPPPAMSVEGAYRLLKVAPGATWEAVEHARRAVVQKSSPLASGDSAAQRGPALAAAQLANSAYAVLAANRTASFRA